MKHLSNKIQIVNTDITQMKVDAIVNAANGSLMGGGGVDGAIHRAAGKELTAFCATLKGAKTGEAKITLGFQLPAKYIIHTVGPVWNNGTKNEEELLASCYRNSLQLAIDNNIRTIAFPSISTGAYKFPFEKACRIALEVVADFLQIHDSIDKVYLVAFGDDALKRYEKISLAYFNRITNNI